MNIQLETLWNDPGAYVFLLDNMHMNQKKERHALTSSGRLKLEALLAALEIRAASQPDASFLRGYISSSATMTFVVSSMLCCAISQCMPPWSSVLRLFCVKYMYCL